jgi:hypothetical protein
MASLRGTVRAAVASAAKTSITALQQSYAYLPKKFDGQSPVLTVESGPMHHTGTPNEPQDIQLILGLWVARDTDASGAEDLLDTLSEALAEFMILTYSADFTRDSEPDYEEVDGLIYRLEFHYVTIRRW